MSYSEDFSYLHMDDPGEPPELARLVALPLELQRLGMSFFAKAYQLAVYASLAWPERMYSKN